MPELPEVQTTVNGLNEVLPGLSVKDAWSGYDSLFHKGKKNIKDKNYFRRFKKEIAGRKILQARRAGKNILIDLSGGLTVLIHMKMTGHLLYGKYEKSAAGWTAKEEGPLKDPFNRHIRFVVALSNGKHMALSDMRKFAKVCFGKTGEAEAGELAELGPDMLSRGTNFKEFQKRLGKKPSGKMKTVLMDQTVLSGIGNIYSDEALWLSGVHPLSTASVIGKEKMKKLFSSLKKVLKLGINFGGDSMSDYRNVRGEKGAFQLKHEAYRRKGLPCRYPKCKGRIRRMVVGGRSAHFCPAHQRLEKRLTKGAKTSRM